MNGFSFVGTICGMLYLAILVLKAVMSIVYLRRHRETEVLRTPVTILQPILGGDPHLESALRSNLDSTTVESHFWWLVDEDDQIGKETAQKLQEEYPSQVRIIVNPPPPDGVNPKSFKLNRVAGEIETEYVAVLDDDTTLSPGHLDKAIPPLLGGVDIYTGLPCYGVGRNIWSSLVAHFVNNNSIATYLGLINWVSPLTINGMFYVVRTDQLQRWGGWEPIVGELCDDYAFARLARKKGGVIHQGITPQIIETTIKGPIGYFRVLHRWFVFANVLVRDQSPGIKILLFVMLGIPPLLLWGSLLLLFGGVTGLILLVCLLFARYCVIRALHYAVFANPPEFSPILSSIAEFLQPLHYLHSLVSPVIIWRSRHICVHTDGTFESLPQCKT